jgi:hypothetical protein
MSHVTPIPTLIRDLDCARKAARSLGIPEIAGATTVRSFYAQPLGDGTFSKDVPVDLVLGRAGYGVGLKRQGDGTYAVVCDVFDCDRQMLAKFGPTYHEWTEGTVPGSTQVGHVPTGRPTLFLQQYAVEAALKFARSERMKVAGKLDAETGAKVLLLTGGYLLPEQSIRVEAKADGTALVSVENVKGSECVRNTERLERFLGEIGAREFTADYYHAPDGSHVRVTQR